MLYKHFRFCFCNVNSVFTARRHTSAHIYTDENMRVLRETFGFTEMETLKLISTQKSLRIKEPAELIESHQFFKKIGITNNDVLKFPALIFRHPLICINHYNTLQDTGCRPIDAALLCRREPRKKCIQKTENVILLRIGLELARKYFRKKVLFLKVDGYLRKDVNIADQLLSVLNPPIEKPKVLRESIEVLDEMIWTEVHRAILEEWLKKRLNATSDDIVKLFRIHKMIKNKSFRTINENITLAESLGINSAKILKCGYILNNHPQYPKTMLKEHPFFAGIDFARYYKINPKLMMINPRRIKEIYSILKEFNVSDELIQRKPDVFCMSPVTLRHRLEEIRKIPEFRVQFDDPRMLFLVVHHNRIKTRLNFLKSLKLRCASLNLIGSLSDPIFENYIHDGRDWNKPSSVINFFCRILGKEEREVRLKLQKHPYFCYVPFVDIDDTFKYLVSIGYTKENLFRCLYILLYPRKKLQLTIKQLSEEEHLRFNDLSQYKQLSMILYRVEKEHHFSGNGIWRTELNMRPADERTLE